MGCVTLALVFVGDPAFAGKYAREAEALVMAAFPRRGSGKLREFLGAQLEYDEEKNLLRRERYTETDAGAYFRPRKKDGPETRQRAPSRILAQRLLSCSEPDKEEEQDRAEAPPARIIVALFRRAFLQRAGRGKR